MAKPRSTGGRFNLGKPYDEMLNDFCEAAYHASATEVVRRALLQFIGTELKTNEGIRERYELRQNSRREPVG